MHNELDLENERRSFRQGREVHSIVLERAWWQELEQVCSRDNLKTWILLWVQEARDKGLNHHALIRFRAHQLVMEYSQEDSSPRLPALASMIPVAEAKQHQCPFDNVKTFYCKTTRCQEWFKDSNLRGFGRCKRLEQELIARHKKATL